MEQRTSVKRFFDRALGRILLGLLAGATLLGSFIYLGPLVSIATFLFFGFAIPVYLGWKRPGQLALMGLVVLIAVAPVAAVYDAGTLRTPSPPASSSDQLPYGNGGAVLQNASVSPFTGAAGGKYTFTVQVHPEFVPANTSGLSWIELIVSTCPGANSSSSPICGSGYPFLLDNRTLAPNLTTPFAVSFNETLNGSNLWWFQFATAYAIGNNTNVTWILLVTDNGYGAVQGPVTGDFTSTVALVVPLFYTIVFLYPGAVFFVALLIYYVFKRREAARRAARGGGAGPSMEGVAGPTAPEGAAPAAPTVVERRCPKCNAVIYPKETTCWKCGTPVPETTPPAAPPLEGGRP